MNLSELLSSLNIPGGAITLAIYKLFGLSEDYANPKAKYEISRMLRNTANFNKGWSVDIARKLFMSLYGERHMSWICLKRSIFTTISVTTFLSLRFWLLAKDVNYDMDDEKISILILFPIFAMAADYLALAKTRFLLGFSSRHRYTGLPTLLIDVSGSALIVVCTISLLLLALQYAYFGLFLYDLQSLIRVTTMHVFTEEIHPVILHEINRFPYIGIVSISIFTTSAWLVTTVMLTILLKILAPIRSFVVWFYIVDKHPIRAAAIFMIISIVLLIFIYHFLMAVFS